MVLNDWSLRLISVLYIAVTYSVPSWLESSNHNTMSPFDFMHIDEMFPAQWTPSAMVDSYVLYQLLRGLVKPNEGPCTNGNAARPSEASVIQHVQQVEHSASAAWWVETQNRLV